MDDRTVLLFSCGVDTLAAQKAEGFGGGGIWSLETDQATGPYDVGSAAVVTTAPLYSGRLIQDRAGQWMMMACHDANSDGSFDGVVSDPIPVRWDAERGSLNTTPPHTSTPNVL
jgi:beta-fructofuranosidase